MAGKLEGSPWIWKDGEFIRWEDAQGSRGLPAS